MARYRDANIKQLTASRAIRQHSHPYGPANRWKLAARWIPSVPRRPQVCSMLLRTFHLSTTYLFLGRAPRPKTNTDVALLIKKDTHQRSTSHEA